MADSKSLKEQAQEAGELFKKVTSEAGEAFKNSNAGKEVLGDDGKFGKEDVEHLKEDAAAGFQKAKTAIVGEDGKFGEDDKARLKKEADALGSMAQKDVSDLVNKK
mgnify:CR=1 FL=1|jgi:ribosome recycling factor